MSIIYPIIAVVSDSIGGVIDKYNFKKTKLKPETLIIIIFATMLIFMSIFLLVTRQTLPKISLFLTGILLLIIIFSFIQNFFQFKAISTDNISLLEPIKNFQPIIASFIAFVLFPSEREIKYIIAIIIGSLVLLWGNTDRDLKLKIDKGIVFYFFATIFAAILLNIYKFTLDLISPGFLFIFRILGVFMLMLIFTKFRPGPFTKEETKFGILSGILYSLASLASLYSIVFLGLNFTIMLLLLGPAVTYTLSTSALKEKIKTKQIIASVILIALIVITNFV